MVMKRAFTIVAIPAALAACHSPEADRARGGGPGADTGNRRTPVLMHQGAVPYHETPHIIAANAPPTEPAKQAHDLSKPWTER
jgi:hypothetical protein